MRVAFGHLDGAVAEEFLDDVEVGSGHDELTGEVVARDAAECPAST